ncbi:hypothetical protein GCM10022204_41570 [Microlunatus aurantiacus]|uniref:ABC transporter domain-containing protein n=2 Tax=Microlunatus aurantiacus TaxID=446786 RepID=A0ABP7ECE8_9ACTN
MRALTVTGSGPGTDGTPVFEGVGFDVPAGSTTAVLGPSGCGKTTLPRLVAGYLRHESGGSASGIVCQAMSGRSSRRICGPRRGQRRGQCPSAADGYARSGNQHHPSSALQVQNAARAFPAP